MKSSKCIALTLAVLFISGCSAKKSVELSADAADNFTSDVSVSAANTGEGQTEEQNISYSQSITSAIEISSEETPEFEKVSLTNLTKAEQIYSSLSNLSEFEYYVTFGIRNDINRQETINIERIRFPAAGLSDNMVGTIFYEPFYKITSGRLSNAIDFSTWLDTFASSRYITKTFRDWYKEKFFISEGNIYASQYVVEFYGNWLVTDNFTLDKITSLDGETIQLDFSFTDYGIEIGSMPEATEYFTVVMKNDYGWKIDSYSEGAGITALINELVFNENPSDLQEQIENYLSANPIS